MNKIQNRACVCVQEAQVKDFGKMSPVTVLSFPSMYKYKKCKTQKATNIFEACYEAEWVIELFVGFHYR